MSRTIIIGDIHGCRDELVDLLDHVGANADDQVISVGDVVDRGPDTAGALRFVRERPNTRVLMGNHERKHVRGTLTYAQEIVRLRMAGDYAEAVAWMGTLPYFYEDAQVRVVHFGCIPGTPLQDTPEDVLSGTTSGEERLKKRLGGRWWHELYDDDKPIVFGHHVVDVPLVVKDRVFGIDTGCCHGGRLTALTVPDFRLWSVPSRGDHWKAEQRRWQIPVLRERPWPEMTWDQLRSKADELERRHPDAAPWLARVRAWANDVQAAIPSLHAAATATLASLGDDPATIAAHPAGNTLHALRRGRLDANHLGCASPAQVHALAGRLGVSLVVPASVPLE